MVLTNVRAIKFINKDANYLCIDDYVNIKMLGTNSGKVPVPFYGSWSSGNPLNVTITDPLTMRNVAETMFHESLHYIGYNEADTLRIINGPYRR